MGKADVNDVLREANPASGHTKAITDAHGNKAFVHESAGTGPAHLKDKHPKGVNTGRKDAHGNDIWETPGKAKKEEEAA